jgi:hypothetical protein
MGWRRRLARWLRQWALALDPPDEMPEGLILGSVRSEWDGRYLTSEDLLELFHSRSIQAR